MKNGVKGGVDRHGNENSSLFFDGQDDYISLEFNGYKILDQSQFLSLAMWIKPLRHSNNIFDNRAEVTSLVFNGETG